MKLLKRILKGLGVLVGLLVLGLVVLMIVLRHPLPKERAAGPEAEALAKQAMAAVGGEEAWQRTGAVRWTFSGRHEHLWDRRRDFERVRAGDLEVLLDLRTRRGAATRAGRALSGAELDAALADAWSWFCNDSFWLNPVMKLFDDGTTRSVVTLPGGEKALLVEYASGGVTPGDKYLWRVGPDGTPRAVRMYVHILPVSGIEFSWDDWKTLPTGAKIATVHKSLLPIKLTDVGGAATLAELAPGPDPFAAIATAR